MSPTIVYMDGEYVSVSDAVVAWDDRAVLYGLGVFETVRILDGHGFLAERHYSRFKRGAKRLDLSPPTFDLGAIVAELARRNGITHGAAKIVFTGGREPDGDGVGGHLFLSVRELAAPSAAPARAVLLSISEGGLRPIAGVKSLSYLPNYLARHEARAQGAEEALFRGHDGVIAEGASSNFFVVRGGVLITHPDDGLVLDGIIRGVVLDLAAELGVEILEREIYESELSKCEEAFITSSLRGVRPLYELGANRWEAPGPITQTIVQAFDALVRQDRPT